MDSQVMKLSGREDINLLTVSQSFEEKLDLANGVNLLPEELITKIFDFVEPYELLKLSKVCQKWNLIIKQPYLWRKKYQRKYKEEPKRYQWYILFSMVTTDFYDFKPVQRGNALYRFEMWTDNTPNLITPVEGYHLITTTGRIPLNLRTISRCTSKTNVYINKPEIMNFGNNRLVTSIVNAFKPIVYTVEWVKFSIITCSCNHAYMAEIINNGRLAEYCTKHAIESAIIKKLTSNWKMTPIVITDFVIQDKISIIHEISINQPITQEGLGDNLIDADVVERKPKIFVGSLPI